jgi:hypothetical protein
MRGPAWRGFNTCVDGVVSSAGPAAGGPELAKRRTMYGFSDGMGSLMFCPFYFCLKRCVVEAAAFWHGEDKGMTRIYMHQSLY